MTTKERNNMVHTDAKNFMEQGMSFVLVNNHGERKEFRVGTDIYNKKSLRTVVRVETECDNTLEIRHLDEVPYAERDLLDRLTLLAIANGNTVSPKPFVPTPAEYKMLCELRIRMGLN